MSLALFLPAIALAGAAPDGPAPFDLAVPVALVQTVPPVVAPGPAPAAAPAVEQAPPPVAVPAPVAPAAAASETVVAVSGHTPGDPLEGFNRRMFGLNQAFDHAVLRPVALGYRHVVPKPVRHGLRNFFNNLGEPLILLNDLLQLKPGRAVKTFGRFFINSTVGLGGFLDVAKTRDFGLPHHDNSIGNTLAFYGVRPGPFLFLPLLGPTTLRDFVGGQGEGFIVPAVIGNPFDRWEYQMPKAVTVGLEARAESDDDLKALLDSAVDPYATLRSVYLQNRQAEVDALHGRQIDGGGTANPLDDPLGDPAGRTAEPKAGAPGTGGASPLDEPLTDPAAAPAPSTTPAARP